MLYDSYSLASSFDPPPQNTIIGNTSILVNKPALPSTHKHMLAEHSRRTMIMCMCIANGEDNNITAGMTCGTRVNCQWLMSECQFSV